MGEIETSSKNKTSLRKKGGGGSKLVGGLGLGGRRTEAQEMDTAATMLQARYRGKLSRGASERAVGPEVAEAAEPEAAGFVAEAAAEPEVEVVEAAAEAGEGEAADEVEEAAPAEVPQADWNVD